MDKWSLLISQNPLKRQCLRKYQSIEINAVFSNFGKTSLLRLRIMLKLPICSKRLLKRTAISTHSFPSASPTHKKSTKPLKVLLFCNDKFKRQTWLFHPTLLLLYSKSISSPSKNCFLSFSRTKTT